MTLAFLTGYRPAIFGLAAADGPEPHCTSCGGSVGIFLGHATAWQHFRTGAADGNRVEVYDTDHVPTIGWRYAAPQPSLSNAETHGTGPCSPHPPQPSH